MVKLHQIVEGHSGCVFMMIDYVCGGPLLDFIHANRHNWEGSPYNQGASKYFKSSRSNKEDSSIASSYPTQSCGEGSAVPRPPLVVDPPTPTDVASEEATILNCDHETSLVTASKYLDLSSDCRPPSQSDNLHFSAASCIDSQQGSPVSSLKVGSSSILERKIVKWAAQIIISLESLHIAGIVCG